MSWECCVMADEKQSLTILPHLIHTSLLALLSASIPYINTYRSPRCEIRPTACLTDCDGAAPRKACTIGACVCIRWGWENVVE
jgi:hypothetical protein